MKRIISLCITVVLTLTLFAGCGGTGSGSSQSSGGNTAATTQTNATEQKTESTTDAKEEVKTEEPAAQKPDVKEEPAATEESATGIDAIELGANGAVEIDFWHIQATIYGEAITKIVDEFNKEYEGKIKVNEIFQGNYTELNQKVKAAFQGGGLPNIAMCYENETAEYMRADMIIPLDDYIASAKYGMTDEELSDMLPAILERQRIPQYDGKTMSFPHGNSAQGVYYNVGLLKQAGYDAPATNWKDFEKMCMDIYEKTGTPALCVGNNPVGSLVTWIRTYGIEPIAIDGSSVDFDNEATVELLDMMKRLIDSGAAYRAENTENDFTGGMAAMEISTTARTSSKIELIGDSFEWDVALIPQGKEGTQITSLYGGNQVMFKSDDEKQLASWIFLKYFASGHAQAIYGSMTGYFPATTSALNDPLIKDNFAQYPQKQHAFDNILPYARIDSPSPARSQVSTEVLLVADNFFVGKQDAAQTAAMMQEVAEDNLEKYR